VTETTEVVHDVRFVTAWPLTFVLARIKK